MTLFANFIHSIQKGDADAVRALGAANPGLVNSTTSDCFGATPLPHAGNLDNRAMVDLLLELGAGIDRRGAWWGGSFGVVASATDEMAAHLLRRGATLPPHAAARLGMVDRLRGMIAAD